jgi:uracil-DNA glycosylase
MKIDMRDALAEFSGINPGKTQLPGVTVDVESIRAVIINEVVPAEPGDDFYGGNTPPEYMKTTAALFKKAGADVGSAADILATGIYLTNAVKEPKTGYAVENGLIEAYIPVLAKELDLFPNLKAVVLAGDVAKKAFNAVAKRNTGKNVVPSGATYKLRAGEFYYGPIRVFPSYIMTGGNILIEKSKVEMASDDIRRMMAVIG